MWHNLWGMWRYLLNNQWWWIRAPRQRRNQSQSRRGHGLGAQTQRNKKKQVALATELGKRQLVEVNIQEADPMDLCIGDKWKRNKGDGNNSHDL